MALGLVVWDLSGAWTARRAAVRAEHQTRAELSAARATLAAARHRFEIAQLQSRRAAAQRDGALLSIGLRQDRLQATDAERSLATGLREGKEAEVALVQDCLHGARLALGALQRSRISETLSALRLVDRVCRAAQSTDAGPAPNYGFDFPDPFVLPVGSDRYAFGTNAAAGTIQTLRRRADAGWETVGDALSQLPGWAVRGHTWAPSVLSIAGRYVLYYTVRDARTNLQCVSRAVSTTPSGPYSDTSAGPLVCGSREAIDPEAVIGADGTPALMWKRERPATIVAQVLSADGLAVTGPERVLLRPGRGWEGGNVEAPSMLVAGNRSWLFFSANSWSSPQYATGMVQCAGPLGPCDDATTSRVLASGGSLVGPGGASVFVDGPGRWGLAYHAYVAPNVGYPSSRFFFTGAVDLTSGRPVVAPG